MVYNFKTKGTCATNIEFELDGDIIKNVKFTGGCNGSLKAIERLVKGKKAIEVAGLLKTVDCNRKGTSCPAQLAIALEEAAKA